ncbi:MAG: preprotein translocase subunit SecE [Kiritimatiellae bacterium]|nr:preprotein translocase subunit SecE [Kiritimatiellia bacterium]MDW8457524.1 preprotein translocase subunit SecE [Verrucomicrobiota bacterium]
MKKLNQYIGQARIFLGEVQTELKKCTWPTRSELFESTVVVVAAVAILGVVVAFSDLVLGVVLRVVTR